MVRMILGDGRKAATAKRCTLVRSFCVPPLFEAVACAGTGSICNTMNANQLLRNCPWANRAICMAQKLNSQLAQPAVAQSVGSCGEGCLGIPRTHYSLEALLIFGQATANLFPIPYAWSGPSNPLIRRERFVASER